MAECVSLTDLIGVRFVSKGRDPRTGLDCWGLFKVTMGRYGHTDIPDFNVDALDSTRIAGIAAIEVASGRWQKIDSPEAGCAVVMENDTNLKGVKQHFGVCIDDRRFIHTLRQTGSIISEIRDPFWSKRIKGFYKWSPLPA